MAVYKCNKSGNTVEVNSPLDIKSMDVHSGYTLVEGYTLVKKYVSNKQEEAPKVTKTKKKKEEVVETEEL